MSVCLLREQAPERASARVCVRVCVHARARACVRSAHSPFLVNRGSASSLLRFCWLHETDWNFLMFRVGVVNGHTWNPHSLSPPSSLSPLSFFSLSLPTQSLSSLSLSLSLSFPFSPTLWLAATGSDLAWYQRVTLKLCFQSTDEEQFSPCYKMSLIFCSYQIGVWGTYERAYVLHASCLLEMFPKKLSVQC